MQSSYWCCTPDFQNYNITLLFKIPTAYYIIQCTRTCDIHGRFQPAILALSAGDKDTDRLGEAANPLLGPFSSVLVRNRRPITGV